METLGMKGEMNFWPNKRVFVTGHTGFKGWWLSACLIKFGAAVKGYSLPPEKESLFASAPLEDELLHVEGDILDRDKLKKEIEDFEPEVIIHMAAQSLVPTSFEEPINTYQTNLIGSLNLLEVIRTLDNDLLCLMVTTDKVYENNEDARAFIETDRLGANDPYSTSKACMELMIASHVKSFSKDYQGKRIHVARAGNVIGGGDWASNRLIPDIIRSVAANQSLSIRNPEAIRPWQHVLDVICGYLRIVEYMDETDKFEAWNLSPDTNQVVRVKEIINAAKDFFPELQIQTPKNGDFHEAQTLILNSKKARDSLKWLPKFDIEQSIAKTMKWYKAHASGTDMRDYTKSEIQEYFAQE